MSNKTGRFGGAKEAALEQVASSAASSISVADAGTREAFLDGWARTLSEHARYLRSTGSSLTAPFVVAFVEDVGQFARQSQWARRAMLGASPKDCFAGILAAAAAEVGGCVHADMFVETSAIEAGIQSAGLQNSPTIALVSESKLLIWPNGIDGVLSPYTRDLDDRVIVVDLNAIDLALNSFYEVAGRQTKKWWKDTSLRTTVEHPEATVQYDLWLFLMAKFAEVARIKMEDISGNGRADITVLPMQKKSTDQSAVLELKTLRDFQTPKKEGRKPTKISQQANVDWACSGVQQTAAYRDHEGLDGAFLCLYDFCAGNTDVVDKAVQPHAMKYNVLARRYWITASHEEHREDRYPLSGTG